MSLTERNIYGESRRKVTNLRRAGRKHSHRKREKEKSGVRNGVVGGGRRGGGVEMESSCDPATVLQRSYYSSVEGMRVAGQKSQGRDSVDRPDHRQLCRGASLKQRTWYPGRDVPAVLGWGVDSYPMLVYDHPLVDSGNTLLPPLLYPGAFLLSVVKYASD